MHQHKFTTDPDFPTDMVYDFYHVSVPTLESTRTGGLGQVCTGDYPTRRIWTTTKDSPLQGSPNKVLWVRSILDQNLQGLTVKVEWDKRFNDISLSSISFNLRWKTTLLVTHVCLPHLHESGWNLQLVLSKKKRKKGGHFEAKEIRTEILLSVILQ